MKPNCFGLPSIMFDDAPGCIGCGFKEQCKVEACARAEKLSEHVQMDDILQRLRGRGSLASVSAPVNVTCSSVERKTGLEQVRVELTGADMGMIDLLPVKVAKKARLLMQTNQDQKAKQALSVGVNPFPLHGQKCLHVACDMLINGGFTRQTLRSAYIERFNWSEGTAYSHVSEMVSLLPALGLAQEIDGCFVARKQ